MQKHSVSDTKSRLSRVSVIFLLNSLYTIDPECGGVQILFVPKYLCCHYRTRRKTSDFAKLNRMRRGNILTYMYIYIYILYITQIIKSGQQSNQSLLDTYDFTQLKEKSHHIHRNNKKKTFYIITILRSCFRGLKS